MTEEPNYYTYFDCSTSENGHSGVGEDLAFCNLWTKIGGKIYCDAHAKLTHCGSRLFSGALIETLVGKE